jgi:hypothetical protein
MHGDELTKLECTIAAILATAGVRQGATENEMFVRYAQMLKELRHHGGPIQSDLSSHER